MHSPSILATTQPHAILYVYAEERSFIVLAPTSRKETFRPPFDSTNKYLLRI